MSAIGSKHNLSSRVLLFLMGAVLAIGVMIASTLPAHAVNGQAGEASQVFTTQSLQTQGTGDAKMYAVLNNGTLTFYDDENMSTQTGTVYNVPENSDKPTDIPWKGVRSNISQVVFDSSFANAKPLSTAYWFYYFENLTTITDLGNLNTSDTANMAGMFMFCKDLSSLNLSVLNTTNVTNMESLLYGCSSLTNVTFGGNFDTSNVTTMKQMLNSCTKLKTINLSSFKTPNLKNMDGMFGFCKELTNLNLGGTFSTANVTLMNSLFQECLKLKSIDLSNFNTSSVTTMQNMFRDCENLATIIYGPNFNTQNVQSMSSMYDGCKLLATVPVSSFNTQNVTTMQNMFNGCSGLTSLTFGGKFTTAKVESMSSIFSGCSSLTALDVSSFDMTKAGSMYAMFSRCTNLRSLTFGSGFDTSNLTGFSYAFCNCSSLAALDISSFDTRKARDMKNMFEGCTALKSIKLGPKFSFKGNNIVEDWEKGWAKLPEPSTTSPYTGKWWKTTGGAQYTPIEIQSLTGADLAGTWSWAQTTPDPSVKPTPIPTVTPTPQAAAQDPITISKVPASVKAKASKNKVTVSWKAIKKTKKTKALLAQIKSVQVQCSTDPAFSDNVIVKKVGKKKTKAVLKLKKKTTYYVRVRYVGADGYSNWSKARKVKTK